MITVFIWANGQGTWGAAEALSPRHTPIEGAVVWVDLESPTEDEERRVLAEFFPVHPLTLEDVSRPRRLPDEAPHLPKVEEFKDYLFVVVNPLRGTPADLLTEAPHDGGRLVCQLSAVLTHDLLVTHHMGPLPAIDQLKDYLRKHDATAQRGPDYLFHLILDVMVDRYAPLLDRLEEALDQLETRVFARPSRSLLTRMLALKRLVIALRKTMTHEREVLARLCRGEFALIDEREMVYYRNVYDHLIRFNELIEGARDMVSDLMQTLLASQANRLNEIMKVLTMISTVILPMSLVAGIYGMNFEKETFWWPRLENPYGFLIALGLMLVSGLLPVVLFRLRKWL